MPLALGIGLSLTIIARAVAGGGGGETDPFSLYSALDKNLFPPHAGAGAWGAQTQIVEPDLPSGLTPVNAANLSELETHCLAGDRLITITGDIGSGGINGNIENVEIILPTGRTMNGVIFGSGGSATVSTRMRIRGTTAGDPTTAGNFHNCRTAGTWTHLVLHGINITGSAELDAYSTFGATNDPHDLVYVIGCRGIAGNDIFLGDPNRIMWVGNSFQAGAAGNGFEQWVIRTQDAGYQIFFNNQFRGYRFDMIRSHPRTGTANVLLWVYHNLLWQDTEESKWVRCDAAFASQTGTAPGVWIEHNDLRSNGPSGTPINVLSGTNVYIRHNTMRTSWGMTAANITVTGATTQDISDNTYTTYAAPTWATAGALGTYGNGDPSALSWDF
jgi:hypothetical protein